MPNRAPAELDWSQPPAGGRGLTRDAIVATAVALADREGLDKVSIRRIAAQLDVRPMSLYTHVASKEDLLDLMVDAAIAEVLVPEPLSEDWRDAVRQIALRSRDAILAHPWTIEAFGRAPRFGPNTLRHIEQSLAAVAGLGLDEQTAATLLSVVDEYALGNAMRIRISPDEVTMRRLLEAAGAQGPVPPPADTFDVGLDALLDGLERTLLRPRR
jgi:AcrR family transcriptional regulator